VTGQTDQSGSAGQPGFADAQQAAVETAAAEAEEKRRLAQKERIYEDLNFASDTVSSQVRQISLGVLALVWALLVGEDKLDLTLGPRPLLLVASLSVLTMMVDFGQYVAAYTASLRAKDRLKRVGVGAYDSKWLSYRIRQASFRLKICLCGITSLTMLVVLGLEVML